MRVGTIGTARYGDYRTARLTTAKPRTTPVDDQMWVRVRERATALATATRALERTLDSVRGRRIDNGVPSVTSSRALGLDATSRASRMGSTARLNETSTTFDPPQPEWTTGSGPSVIVDGAAAGTDTYTFEVTRLAQTGTQADRVDVFDGSGTRVDRLQVSSADRDTTAFALGSGLTVTFGAGNFEANARFVVETFPSRPAVVDPDAPFDGTGSQYPNLQPGLAVTTGAFTVEGTSIAVGASDSITDVLDRITAETGITASFDATTQTVSLVRDDPGDLPITLAGDTSGFLAAMKLTTAEVAPGRLPDYEEVMSRTTPLGAVQAGTVTINGVVVTLDPSVDSLDDVLDRISASAAGVVAIRHGSDSVTITGRAGEQLTLDDGGTGFFDALDLRTGTVRAELRGRARGISAAAARRVADATAEVGRALDALMATTAEGSNLERSVTGFGNDVRRIATRAFEFEGGGTATASGLRFDLDPAARRLFGTTASDQRSHASALQRDYRSFHAAMTSEWTPNGPTFLSELMRLTETLASTAAANAVISL